MGHLGLAPDLASSSERLKGISAAKAEQVCHRQPVSHLKIWILDITIADGDTGEGRERDAMRRFISDQEMDSGVTSVSSCSPMS